MSNFTRECNELEDVHIGPSREQNECSIQHVYDSHVGFNLKPCTWQFHSYYNIGIDFNRNLKLTKQVRNPSHVSYIEATA